MTTSTNSIDTKINKFLKKAFYENDYDIEIVGDELKIKDKEEIDNILTISYEELTAEFAAVNFHGPYYTVGENFINFILFDNRNVFNGEKITINGFCEGKIVKEYNSLALLISNIDKVINYDSFKQNRSCILEDVIDRKVLICELKIENELLEGGISDSEKELRINQIINSVLSQIALKFNVVLHNPRNLLSQSTNNKEVLGEEASISVKYIKDYEPVLYFLAAEEIDFPHLKYLEYYHVLEYYFLHKRVKAMDGIIQQLISTKLVSGNNIYDGSYYLELNELIKYKFDTDFNKEISQLKDIILTDIGFNSIKVILTRHGLNLGFLSKPLFNIDETIVSNLNKVYNTSQKSFKEEPKEEDKNLFCNELAKRIYKIRNHIVHTKKFEKSHVFVPSQENYEALKNDITLIRLLSHFLMAF
ncbi:hypothetical protein PDL10_16890 [Bacillus cereus]|nr:hypothetical protein [Bacillus cereus]